MGKILAAKIILLLVLTVGTLPCPARAGIPTLDSVNLVQNIIAVIEEIAQTMKQIQEYKTQVEQYQNQLQNSMAPASNIWEDAQGIINGLIEATDMLNYYERQLGSIDAYLDEFHDLDYYTNSPCLNGTGCTDEEYAALTTNRRLAFESQEKANDAIFKSLVQQQGNLKDDAKTLRRLQSAAQGADGQMAALGYANQFASHQSNQLMQIRGLLIAQHSAVAAKMQADVDREAQEQAAHEASTDDRIKQTPDPKNWLELTR